MTNPRRDMEIKGGAGEFEAAVIAVVLDRLSTDAKVRSSRASHADNRVPAWVRAIDPDRFPDFFDQQLPH